MTKAEIILNVQLAWRTAAQLDRADPTRLWLLEQAQGAAMATRDMVDPVPLPPAWIGVHERFKASLDDDGA